MRARMVLGAKSRRRIDHREAGLATRTETATGPDRGHQGTRPSQGAVTGDAVHELGEKLGREVVTHPGDGPQ